MRIRCYILLHSQTITTDKNEKIKNKKLIMRKLLFAALLAVSLSTSAFAEGTKVSVSVANSFKTEFSNAANVTWDLKDEYAKATFTVDNVKMEAFYNQQGELIGKSKGVNLQDLPVSAKRAFAKKYQDYTVKEVIYFEGSDDSAYFLSAENEKESIIFKVGDNAQLTTFKQTKK